MSRKYEILSVMGKCSDRSNVGTVNIMTNEDVDHDGYVPEGLGIGGGDYIEFDIDIETGQILNWPKLTDEDIEEALK